MTRQRETPGSGDVEVRRLTEADAERFWALRLRALRENPEAYGRSYEETRATPIDAVRERFRGEWTLPRGFVLGAVHAGELVGIVGLRREDGERQRHKATIWGVYVAPEARRRGLARALLGEALAQAKAMPGLEQVQLSVGSRSPEARALYASFGFQPFGLERRAIKHGDQYVDEEHMVLHLDPPAAP